MGSIGLPALLKTMVDQSASDLHITVGAPPIFRINGKMIKAKADKLFSENTQELCYSVMTEAQISEFEKTREIDFSFGIREVARFRANLFFQRGSIGGVFRLIPFTIPKFEDLNLPPFMKSIIQRPNGLVLVTGPTGSGKSTSLAAMIDVLNRTEPGHIMTIEDPIEFVHPHKNCIVNQREVGIDTKNFASALRRILRQDPNYILIGEMRDMETIEMALTMAETGHLVFATLHTNNAAQSIHRIVNVFPPHQQPQIRQSLSLTLQSILSQQLVERKDETGRALACELLIPTMAVRNLIREDKVHQIYSAMQAGQESSGMLTMNQSLVSLVKAGFISKKIAILNSQYPDELSKILTGDDD